MANNTVKRSVSLGSATFEYAKRDKDTSVLLGASEGKNNGGLLGGARYLGAGAVAGVGGIFEGISDLVVGSAALLSGDKEYAKYVFRKDEVGEWFRAIEEEYDPGAGMKFFGDTVQGLGQSAVMLVPYVGTVAFFGGVIGQGVGEGVRQTGELGLREYAYGTLTGVTEGLLEKFVGAGGRAAKRLATGTAATSLIKSGVRNGVLKTMLSEASGEFVEEFASAYTDVMWQRLTGVNKQATVSLRDAAYAGLVGFVSGGIMSGSVYGINAGVNAHRGAVIREEGNTQTMLNTATAISASIKGKKRFRGDQALPALRASMDAFSKLSDEAKASTRGDMLLGEIQAATAQLEVAMQVDDRVKVIQSGDAEDLTRYAAVASQYLGYTVTPEMVKNDTDGVASAVAIVDFVTGMVTNSKAAAFEAEVARVIESDTAPALKGVQDFDESADHQYYKLGDQVISTVRVVGEDGKVSYNFGIGSSAKQMGMARGLDAKGVRARIQAAIDGQNKKAAEAAQRATQTRGEASEVTDKQGAAQNAAEGKKTGTKGKRRGEVRFEDGVSATTREQKQAVGLARVLSRVVGMDIVFYDAKNYEAAPDGTNEKNSNGFFDPKDNSIHLDMQNAATDNKTVTYTLSHELVHFIKKWSPEKYNAFARFLFSQYEDYGISPSALVAGKMASLKTNDASGALEELVADACERLLTDSRAVTRLAALRSSDLTLFEKIKLHLEQMYARITHANVRANTVEGRALELMKDELGRINKLFEDAAVDAAENYQSSTEKGAKQQTGDDSARRQAKGAQGNVYDYSKSFSEQIDDYKAGLIPQKDTLLVSGTPDVWRKVGFNALPVTINQTHVDYALNGTKDADHYIGEALLKDLPNAIKHPVAIIQSQSPTRNDRAVVILKMMHNGKNVIGAIEVDGQGVTNNISIDSNAMTSVFAKSNAIIQLGNAISNTVRGKVELFYWNKKEAIPLLQKAGLQLSRSLPQDGFVHSIHDNGSNVKTKFKNVVETQQFKRWFGDWQNNPRKASKIVNADGSPKVMYHGSQAKFTVFDIKKAKSSGLYGKGFYFTDSESHAGQYGEKYAVYLNIRHPLTVGGESVTREQVRAYLQAVSENEDYSIENYGTYDIDSVLDIVMGTEKRKDAFAVIGDINGTAIGDLVEAAKLFNEVNGTSFDGIVVPTETVAFYPNQIKSATDNIGTFDGGSSDIRYQRKDSRGQTATDAAYISAVESGDLETARAMIEKAAKAAGYTEVLYGAGDSRFRRGKDLVLHGTKTDAAKDAMDLAKYQIRAGLDEVVASLDATVDSEKVDKIADSIQKRLQAIRAEAKRRGTNEVRTQNVAEKAVLEILRNEFGKQVLNDETAGDYAADVSGFSFEARDSYDNNEAAFFVNTDGMLVIDCAGSKLSGIRSKDLPNITTMEDKRILPTRLGVNRWTMEKVGYYAENNGYSGVVFKNVKSESPWRSDVGTSYLVFNPSERIVDTTIEYDADGNVVPLSKKFSSESVDNEKNGESSYAPTFYSKMAKVIDGIKSEKLGASSVVSYLTGKGIKKEEIKWSGIEAFLDGKKSVTKQELKDFVDTSMLRIDESVTEERFFDSSNNVLHTGKSFREAAYAYADRIGVSRKLVRIVNDTTGATAYIRNKPILIADVSGTRWKAYTLNGGDNYRELVFTLPNSSYKNASMLGHWERAGVLAHARIQDLATKDGRKMLFVEEIQSDWHNEGHKHGYEGDANVKPATLNVDEQSGKKAVPAPDAPFRDNYQEFVMKRLLRMAAEEGYDSIGWTTAKIQRDRWSDEFAEGYRIEYDQDIPSFMRKYGKKWGATVGQTKTKNGDVVWVTDITESMKQSVLYEGQVMFQKKTSKVDPAVAAAHREAAVERFGITNDFREAGFVLPDGSMLDFSGGIKGRRGDDHGKIRLIYDEELNGSQAIARFLSEGNVRISEMARGIEVGEGEGLTASQYNAISRFVSRMRDKGVFYVDYTRADGSEIGSATYEGNVSAEEVIWDIKDFYRSGEVRDPSSEVYYQKKGTDAIGNPDNELRLADLPPVDEGKKPARVEPKKPVKATRKVTARERDLRERNARQAGMVRDLREENRHLRRRNVVEGRAFRSVDFLSKMIKERKYISSGVLENEDMKAAIKPLTRIKSVYRMKQDAALIRECIRDFGVFYSTRNDMFIDESAKKDSDEQADGEKWVIRTSIVEDIAMISARVGSDEGLSLEEFEAVDRVLQEAARMYREYGTVVIKGRRMVTAKLAEDTLHDLQVSHSSASGAVKSGVMGWMTKVGNVIKKVYTYQVIDPRSVIRAMEGYSRKGMLSQLFDEVREGEVQSRIKQVEMTKPIDEFLKTHKGYEKRLKTGKIVFDGHEVTVGQAISLYELSKREQAILHLEKGGIKWEGPDGELRSLKSFTLNNAREIERQLNEDDRAFIALVEHFFNADAKAVKEAADAKILGYTNTLSSHYFPIKVDGTEIPVDVSNLSRMLHQQIMTVYNASFNKNTVKDAQNPLIVGNVLDVTFSHAQLLAHYSELYLPMQAFNKVYNARVEVAPTQHTTVRKYLERVWQANSKTQASGFEKYITKLFADIQGVGPERGTFDRLLAKFRGGFYSSALGLNPGTAAKQPTSLPMILADPEVDMDCFVKSFSMPSGKRMLEVMDKYCPLAFVKNAEGGAAQAFAVVDKIRGIGEKTMFMITGMDRQLTCRIFCVAQQQILKDKGYALGTEENLREAGKLAQRLMFKTQSGYTTTERSGMMRSTSEIARTATMFTSDAMKHLSCYVDALGEFEANRRRLKREDTAENRAAWRRSKEAVARVVGAQVSSAVLLALVAQLFRWIYDKEPEEGETVLWTMTKDFVGTELGMLPVVSQVTDYFIEGYDISHFTYDMVNDLFGNVRGLTQLALDAASGKPVDEKAIAQELRKLAFNAGTLTGIPFRNVHTTVYGLWKRLEPATAYKYNTLYYDATVGDLQKALDRGNERLAQSVLEVLQKEKTSEKTKGTAVRELVSLYDAGYDEIVPRGVPSQITVPGETEDDPKKVVVLTAAQVKQFEKIYGGSAEAVASLVKRGDYLSLGEEERAQAVKLVYDTYYNKAAHAVVGVKLSRMSVLSEVVDIERLAVNKATISAMEDTVRQTKKQQAVAYVKSLKLAAGEREAVLYACGYGGEAVETALVAYINRAGLTEEQLAAFAALLDGDTRACVVRNGRLVLTKKK